MVQPDPLDRRILRELESPGSFQWNVRESYSAVAKKLGVDEETVRKRVSRIRSAGILKGWELVVNPSLIGRESASVELQVREESEKAAAVDRIKLMDGVISILDFSGPGLQVGIYFRQEGSLARLVRLMESVCGREHSMLWRVAFPPCDLKMTKTDWTLLDTLRKDPRGRLTEIAAEAKVSTRTVSRRLERMVDGYAFFLNAVIDFRRLGGLAYRLLVRCRVPSLKARVDRLVQERIGERLGWTYTFSDEYSMYVLYCENVAEAKDISTFVRNLVGVDELRMDIIEKQTTVDDWIADEISAAKAAPSVP